MDYARFWRCINWWQLKATRATGNQRVRELRAELKRVVSQRDEARHRGDVAVAEVERLRRLEEELNAELQDSKQHVARAQARVTQLEVEAGVREGGSGLTGSTVPLEFSNEDIESSIAADNKRTQLIASPSTGSAPPAKGRGKGIASLYRREMARMSRVIELRDARIRGLEKELAVQRVVHDSTAVMLARSSAEVGNQEQHHRERVGSSTPASSGAHAVLRQSFYVNDGNDRGQSNVPQDDVGHAVPSLSKSVRFTPGTSRLWRQESKSQSHSVSPPRRRGIPISPVDATETGAGKGTDSPSSRSSHSDTDRPLSERALFVPAGSLRSRVSPQSGDSNTYSERLGTSKANGQNLRKAGAAGPPTMDALKAKLDAVREHYRRLSAL